MYFHYTREPVIDSHLPDIGQPKREYFGLTKT